MIKDTGSFYGYGEVMSISEIMETLRSLASNVSSLEKGTGMMKWHVAVVVGVGMTVIGIISIVK